VFGKRTPRRRFEPKREDVKRKWGRLNNEECKDMHSDNQIKKNQTGVRSEGRRPLGRPRRRWEDNIKMDLRDVNWGHGMD
jgi:hypothetical protein